MISKNRGGNLEMPKERNFRGLRNCGALAQFAYPSQTQLRVAFFSYFQVTPHENGFSAKMEIFPRHATMLMRSPSVFG